MKIFNSQLTTPPGKSGANYKLIKVTSIKHDEQT